MAGISVKGDREAIAEVSYDWTVRLGEVRGNEWEDGQNEKNEGGKKEWMDGWMDGCKKWLP